MPRRNNTCWAVVPAAGVGARMALAKPKQYLEIAGKTLLEYSVGALLNSGIVDQVVVALAADDTLGPSLAGLRDNRVSFCDGGTSRATSVLAGLDSLAACAQLDDWVMVHDAARPCVGGIEIKALYGRLQTSLNGGLWAIPVADTLKRAVCVDSQQRIEATVARDNIWRAQTPQMFRYGALRDALCQALIDAVDITDESSAMLHAGVDHELIEGPLHNIKVTYPADQLLAEFYLTQMEIRPCE